MARVDYECSSRKVRKLPQIPALGRVGARHPEKASNRQIFMQHNKGLCCMFGQGAGVKFPARVCGC
jgi:hypothetical protein